MGSQSFGHAIGRADGRTVGRAVGSAVGRSVGQFGWRSGGCKEIQSPKLSLVGDFSSVVGKASNPVSTITTGMLTLVDFSTI